MHHIDSVVLFYSVVLFLPLEVFEQKKFLDTVIMFVRPYLRTFLGPRHWKSALTEYRP